MVDGSGIIHHFTGDIYGSSGYDGDGYTGGASWAHLDQPCGIAYDPVTQNIFIADSHNDRIRYVDHTTNTINTYAGDGSYGYSGDGGAATSAKLRGPEGIAFDAAGNLYIADESNCVIRRVDHATHVITTIAGQATSSGAVAGYTGDGGAATAATLNSPVSVSCDASGNIYISDFGNNVIREVNVSTGIISTVVGTGTASFYGDGGPATDARLFNPYGIVIGTNGNLYICDQIETGIGSTAIEPHLREVCLAPTPTISLPTTTLCSGSPFTINAISTNTPCGATYSWYTSPNGLIPPTMVAYGSSNSYTETMPTPGETIYCVMDAPNITDICYSGPYTSNTVTVAAGPQITDIDINTICVPGYSSISLAPTFSVTVTGGSGTYTYLWGADTYPGSSTLDDPTLLNPTVTSVVYPNYDLNRLLTVSDADGCVATHQVFAHFIKNGVDLASRDNHFDLYMEPFTMAYHGMPDWNIWNSTFVWNRNANDGILGNQPPNYTATNNYAFYNVKNVGCTIYDPASYTTLPSVNLYWTIGNFAGAETWSNTAGLNDWVDATYFSSCGGGGYIPLGGLIATVPLTSVIIPGDYFTNATSGSGLPWSPPYPACYSPSIDIGGIGSGTIEVCLLSRIVDYHNLTADPVFGMTYAEMDGNEKYNVLNNNNISTLNTTDMYVSGPSPYSPIHHVFTGYSYGYTGPVSLQFANDYCLYPGTGTSVLNQYMSMTIYLGDSLFNKWYNAGAYGTYTSYDNNTKSIMFDGTTTVQLDSIVMDSGALYMITIAPGLLSGIDGASMPAEMVHFRTLKDDTTIEVLGCYNYNVVYHPAAPGVLTVTELSLGPSSPLSCTGSQYAELLVNNCGTDAGQQVDISNWIFDDNSGNFDMEGCADGLGITRGHYRFANIDLWHNVPVGSRIVLYNGTANCYNLPDIFTYDTANSIFWLPVPDTNATKDYVLQRYAGSENVSMCSYCSDTAITTYTDAYGWMNTINFDTLHDAVQVRCPGCSKAFTGTPSFYQGMGYANTIGSGYMSITANMNELGGPVDYSAPPVMPRKFVFTGKDSSDFHQSSLWLASNADTAGVVPPGLGYVSDSLQYKSVHHLLNLPCCNYSAIGGRKSSKGNTKQNTALQTITIYPNPAHTELNFALLQTDNAQINLFTITGQLVRSININNSNLGTIQVSGLPPGLYIYKAVTNSKTQTGKIIIE